MSSATVVVPTWNGVERLAALLASLARQTVPHEVIVVDNGSTDGTASFVRERHPRVRVLELPTNEGFSRPVNLGARAADGEVIVLVNDDCVCDDRFVEALAHRVDAAAGVVMAAGVLRDGDDASRIDTAGMELDRTLLVFDYLNGEPVDLLDGPVADPIGPCAAAAAFDRAAFLEAGGFDEHLFAYWEDVDLVLRLRRAGGRCALAPDARGVHAHSATLGSGSARKNYLTGFGRGYLARRWSVLAPRRLPAVLARDLTVCLGQAFVDRNLAGSRGRLEGWRAAGALSRRPYPGDLVAATPHSSLAGTLARRARRRVRLRARAADP